MENKKVKNATPLEYEGITFKSKLEAMAYKTLKEEGFDPQYENTKYVLWEGFKPTVPFYDKNVYTHMLKQNQNKLINITYTPDISFDFKDKRIFIELKGFLGDKYPIKKKMFRKYLEDKLPNSMYFEVYTKKQLMQAIDIIKQTA